MLTTDGWSEDEVLRLSACLEEHFPHPVARAVINAARERGLEHRERHAAVEYIVAHGIASSIEWRRAIIGSAHFVFEDESAQLDSDIKERIESQMQGLSPLYLAVDGKVVGVLGIEDPLKLGVREAIADLHALGVKHVVMLTGDSERTAERIAREAGVDEFKAELLPEDKYAYVERIKREGATLPWWATASTTHRRWAWPMWVWPWAVEATLPRRSPTSSWPTRISPHSCACAA